MSAVGLMLLEDPKARARAEARIRNGTARQRSFFGRSSKSSTSSGGSRRRPDLPPTILDEDGEGDSPIIRPSTSLSQTIALPHRKKAESTSDKGSTRNSIFGRKNSVGASSINSGSSGRVSQLSGAVSSYSREPVHEEEYYQEPRKPTTLPSSQNQHTKNAPKTQLLLPERVDSTRLWSTSKYKKSRAQTNGVQADDWATEKRDPQKDSKRTVARPHSPIDQAPPRLPAAARISFFDDTIFNNVKDAPFDPEDEGRALQNLRQTPREAKRYSTMVARNSLMFPEEPILQTPGISSDSKSYGDDERQYFPHPVEVKSITTEPLDVASKGANAKASDVERQDLVYGPRLSSLPVPSRNPTAKSSKSSLASTSQTSQSTTNLSVPLERTVAKESNSSSPSGSTSRSPALSFSNNVRESTVFADSTWEDDIDFVYEQEAEATCDFDWDPTNRNSLQSDGGVRLSVLYGPQDPMAYDDDTRYSQVFSNEVYDGRDLSTGATTVEHTEAQKFSGNSRGSSVGHRGFAAARNSKGDYPKADQLPNLSAPGPSPQGDSLSPVCSEATDSENETPRSPQSPALDFPMPPGSSNELDFPLPPGGSDPLEFPMPPSGSRTSADNLSQTYSWRSSSKHRKSSSYGSYESLKRTSTAPSTAPSSVQSSRDTGRWSLASAGSVPSLPTLASGRPKRASSLSKAMVSPPLETLMQRPEEDEKSVAVNDERIAPNTLLVDPEAESYVMRRPRTSGDRRLLQAAGRAVQRYRPTTPNMTSRGLRAPEGLVGTQEHSTGRLGWI